MQLEGVTLQVGFFSVGKSVPLKRLKASERFQELADVFLSPASSKEGIISAGEKVIVDLYGGKPTDTLNELRYVRYVQKMSTSKKAVQPSNLPPTASAAKFHSMRTYYQTYLWMNLAEEPNSGLDPTSWVWEKKHGALLPILSDMPVAPEDLLNVIHCSCKAGCATSLCTCRKHGLVCATSCTDCRGDNCSNSVSLISHSESESEEDFD